MKEEPGEAHFRGSVGAVEKGLRLLCGFAGGAVLQVCIWQDFGKSRSQSRSRSPAKRPLNILAWRHIKYTSHRQRSLLLRSIVIVTLAWTRCQSSQGYAKLAFKLYTVQLLYITV